MLVRPISYLRENPHHPSKVHWDFFVVCPPSGGTHNVILKIEQRAPLLTTIFLFWEKSKALFIASNKLIDCFSVHCNKDQLTQRQKKPWEQTRVRGHSAEERLDVGEQEPWLGGTEIMRRARRHQSSSADLQQFQQGFLVPPLPSARAQIPARKYLHTVTSALPSPSIICPLQFHWFSTTLSFVPPQTSCTSLPMDNLLLTLALIWTVKIIISRVYCVEVIAEPCDFNYPFSESCNEKKIEGSFHRVYSPRGALGQGKWIKGCQGWRELL